MENSVFSKNESGKISTDYVAVKLTGGDDITPEVRTFMDTYGVRSYPTMFVMNAAGHVVNDKIDRSVEGILGALKKGDENEVAFAAAKKKTDPAGQAELAGMLKSRRAWTEALALYESIAKTAPSADVHENVAQILGRTGKKAEEKALLEKMVGLYPKSDKRPDWRIRIAMQVLDGVNRSNATEKFPAAATSMEALLVKVLEEKDVQSEPAVRTQLGNMLAHPYVKRAEEGGKQFDLVLEKFKDTRYAPTALMGKANIAWRATDYEGCKVELKKILDSYPDSDEAKSAPRGIQNCDARLKKMKR